MKLFINLKSLLLGLLLILNLQFLIINQQPYNLYAQNSMLFENTWYLHNLVIDENSNIPPVNDEIPFVPADFYENGVIYTGMCEEGGAGELEYIGTTEFNVLEMNFLQGGCHQNHPYNQSYSGLYQSFWGPLVGIGLISYEIIEDEQIRTLIITSPNGDYAMYSNEVPLSTGYFTYNHFILYPNPVKETLNINNNSNQQVSAIIYDLNGKLIQSHVIDNEMTALDVKNLNQGLYFIVFETETGERVSKKFVKK